MVFLTISAFALALVALAAGAGLTAAFPDKALPKVVGILVMLGALLAMACAFYHGLEYRQAGLFEAKASSHEMGGGGMKCPMMEKMMMEKMKQGAESQEHEGHH